MFVDSASRYVSREDRVVGWMVLRFGLYCWDLLLNLIVVNDVDIKCVVFVIVFLLGAVLLFMADLREKFVVKSFLAFRFEG